MSRIIGIDLGTSTTEVSIINNGKPEMVLNLDGNIITPTMIGIADDGRMVFGERARAQLLTEPEKTVMEIKRKIGTGEMITMDGKQYSAMELSARFLQYVKIYVEEALGEEVNRAVISVPAYFDDKKRQETMEAGKKAGFQVERILNEPTAAALSYGLEHLDEESHILIYDFGGGTFDVTLLEMFDGVLEVKASSGDNALGGKDFDEIIVDHLVKEFKAKEGLNLRKIPTAMVRLKEEAQKAKILLSVQEDCRIIIPFIAEKNGQPVSLDYTMTRKRFEEMAKELIDRTHRPMEVVFADSEINKEDIDHILLVGGSTRMPMIVNDVEAYLGKKPLVCLDPDFAVAQGTAIQAGLIEGTIDAKNSIFMTDVNPFTLGIRTFNGFSYEHMSVIIPRNVTIPVTKSDIFSTVGDMQTKVSIEVYQGESHNVNDNHFLGEFMIRDIPPKKQGKEKIEVEFSYNINGLLEVKATILSTGQEAGILINMIDKDREESRRDVSEWKKGRFAKEFRTVIRWAEKQIKMDPENSLWEHELYKLKLAILEDDYEYAREIADKIEGFRDLFD